jgi:hypothetical protein
MSFPIWRYGDVVVDVHKMPSSCKSLGKEGIVSRKSRGADRTYLVLTKDHIFIWSGIFCLRSQSGAAAGQSDGYPTALFVPIVMVRVAHKVGGCAQVSNCCVVLCE